MEKDSWKTRKNNLFNRLEKEVRKAKEDRAQELEEASEKRQRGRTNGPIVNSVWTLRK